MTEFGEQRGNGEDEAVERSMMGNILNLGRNGFVGERRGWSAWLCGFMELHQLVVDVVDQILPCPGDGSGIAVIGGVVDEQTQVVVPGLIGIIVEELGMIS